MVSQVKMFCVKGFLFLVYTGAVWGASVATTDNRKIIDYGGLTSNASNGILSKSSRMLAFLDLGQLERPPKPRPIGRPNQGEHDRPKPDDHPHHSEHDRPKPDDHPHHNEHDRPKPDVNDRPSNNGEYQRPNSNDHPNHGSSKGPQPIPGTNLKTRTFYKLSMKLFPYGYVTWTSRKNFQHGYRYIHVDNNRDHVHYYEKNGELFYDVQWEFVPVASDDRYHWYKLRNRGRPREYSTWSLNEYINEYGQSNYLILDPNYPGRRSRTDFLFRPVLVQGHRGDGHEEKDYYQLKLKENRRAVISFNKDSEYDLECYYIQVDNDSDERHMRRYEKGYDRFDDTLFSIDLADREYIDDEEDIEDSNDVKLDFDL